jgi:hypothetical protein
VEWRDWWNVDGGAALIALKHYFARGYLFCRRRGIWWSTLHREVLVACRGTRGAKRCVFVWWWTLKKLAWVIFRTSIQHFSGLNVIKSTLTK